MENKPYSQKVIEHFRNPHNYGRIDKPDGIGKVGNIRCGDLMNLYIKVENNIIKNIKFETFGCVAAIATSSIVTDLVKGKTISQALKVDNEDVVKALGGLPMIKIHCSLLVIDALFEAIYDYLSKNKKPISDKFKKKHQQIKKEQLTNIL